MLDIPTTFSANALDHQASSPPLSALLSPPPFAYLVLHLFALSPIRGLLSPLFGVRGTYGVPLIPLSQTWFILVLCI